MFSAIKRFFYRNNIENLTVYIVMVTTLVSGFCYLYAPTFGEVNAKILTDGEWFHLLVYPFRIKSTFLGSLWMGLFLYLYIFFFLGNMLEGDLGPGQYNLFMLIGFITCILGAFASLFKPLEITSSYIYLSTFLAVAYRFPDMEIYIFFILPVKLKWLGTISLVFLLISMVLGISKHKSAYPALGVVLGLSNLLLFYGKDIWGDIRLRYRHQLTTKMPVTPTIHRCYVCGITEKDDPNMEFRYCVECKNQEYEYCMDHLYNHEHVK
ncbi:MAG: hypothetical protein AAF518_26700 [Spirochaetota bacterium]